jgi:hypothetical protein
MGDFLGGLIYVIGIILFGIATVVVLGFSFGLIELVGQTIVAVVFGLL